MRVLWVLKTRENMQSKFGIQILNLLFLVVRFLLANRMNLKSYDNWKLCTLSGSTLIQELKLLDEIETIAEEYEAAYGTAPTNLSTWDPAADVIKADLLATMPTIMGTGKNYIFSYTLKTNTNMRNILGYSDDRWKSLVSHSGSASIVMTCNWMRSYGAKKILILGPRYFTVPHCLNAMGLKFDTQHCQRTISGYTLPLNLNPDDYDGVWVTNPIYGTGVQIELQHLINLQHTWSQADRFFVLDECLAAPQRYAGPALEPHSKTTILAAPHKSICVNAYKFATSIFEESQLEHFEHWSDIWLGCLPQSSHQAIEHVRSGGFSEYHDGFELSLGHPISEFKRLTKGTPEAKIDATAEGYFRSVYFPSLAANLGYDVEFLREATIATGASFIPGIRNELDPSVGLSFRVNIAAFDADARGAFVRLIRWLASRC